LKQTNDLLEKGLEEQKKANLDNYGQANEQGRLEANLVLEERVAKAEGEVEKLRAENINSIEMLKKEKSAFQDSQMQNSQLKLEIKTKDEKIVAKEATIDQMQEMNNQNKMLTLERNELRQQISELRASQEKLKNIEASQGILEFKAQM